MASTPRQLGTLIVVVLKAKNLPNKRHIGKQDPYATVTLNGDLKRTKAVKRGGQHPEWDEEFRFPVYEDVDDVLARTSAPDGDAPPPPPKDATPKQDTSKAKSIKGGKTMRVQCFADDPRDPEFIGEGVVDLDEVLTKGETDEWFTIYNKERYSGEVYLELTFWSSEAPRAKKAKPRPSQPEYGGPGTHTSTNDLSLSGGPSTRPALPSEFSSSDSLRGRNASGATVVPDSLRPSNTLAMLDLYVAPYEHKKPDVPPVPPLPPGALQDGYDEFGGSLAAGRRGESMPARGGQRPASLYDMPSSQSLSSHHMHQPSLSHWDSSGSLAESFSHMSMSSGHDIGPPQPPRSPLPRPHSQSFSGGAAPIPQSLQPGPHQVDSSWAPPRPNTGFQPINSYSAAQPPFRGTTPTPMSMPSVSSSTSLQLPNTMPVPGRAPSPYGYPPPQLPANYGPPAQAPDAHTWQQQQYPTQSAPGTVGSPQPIPLPQPSVSPPRAASARPLPPNPASPSSQYPPPHNGQGSYTAPPAPGSQAPFPPSSSYYGAQPAGQSYPPSNSVHSPIHANSLPSPPGAAPPGSYPLPPPPHIPHRSSSVGHVAPTSSAPPPQQYTPPARPPMAFHSTSEPGGNFNAGPPPRPVSSMSYHQQPPQPNYQQLPPQNYQPPLPPHAQYPPPSVGQPYQQPQYGRARPGHTPPSASSYVNSHPPWNTNGPPPPASYPPSNPPYPPPQNAPHPPPNSSYPPPNVPHPPQNPPYPPPNPPYPSAPAHSSYPPPPGSGYRPPYPPGPPPPASHLPPPPSGPAPPGAPDYPAQPRPPMPQSSFSPPPMSHGYSAPPPPNYGRPAPPPLPNNYGPSQQYPPHGPPPPSSLPYPPPPGQGNFSPPPMSISPGGRPLPPVSPYRNA